VTDEQFRSAIDRWRELENAGARCTVQIYRTSRATFWLHIGATGSILCGIVVAVLTSFTWYVASLYGVAVACHIVARIFHKRCARHLEAHRQVTVAMLREVEALAIPEDPAAEIVGEGRRAGGDAQPSTPQPLSPDPDSDSKWLL
jgi:hypothetical protein